MDLRQIRKSLGYTQAEFAKEMGVSSSNMARMERGELEPTPTIIGKVKQFCDKHGVDFACENRSFAAWHLSTMYGMKN